MKKLIFIVLLCMGVCLYAAAEPMAPKASLTGKVTDAVDNSALVGVAISISELSQGVTTDARGNYSFRDLPMRTVTLQVSYLGHQTIIRKVDLS